MPFLNNDDGSTIVSLRLTNAGRKLIAQGFKLDNIFDVVKFSFGDSEIDYDLETASIEAQEILDPETGAKDLTYKLYASGIEPSGDAIIQLSSTELNLSTYQSNITVSVSTQWEPVDGNYIEKYSWTNLGPLEDYDFGITTSIDTTTATIRTLGVVGTTYIRVRGETSGKYSILTLNIT